MATLLLSVMGAFAEFERALIGERQREGVVGRGKWPGLIELFGAVWTADLYRRTRRPAIMPPASRLAAHMRSKREPFSATKVRQTIRSFVRPVEQEVAS